MKVECQLWEGGVLSTRALGQCPTRAALNKYSPSPCTSSPLPWTRTQSFCCINYVSWDSLMPLFAHFCHSTSEITMAVQVGTVTWWWKTPWVPRCWCWVRVWEAPLLTRQSEGATLVKWCHALPVPWRAWRNLPAWTSAHSRCREEWWGTPRSCSSGRGPRAACPGCQGLSEMCFALMVGTRDKGVLGTTAGPWGDQLGPHSVQISWLEENIKVHHWETFPKFAASWKG